MTETRNSIPAALTMVLERRYLSALDPASWQFVPADADNSVPTLHEVIGLGRPEPEDAFARVMQYVVSAAHNPGHDLIMALFGQGERHRLFFGLRRRAGGGSSSTAMAGLLGAFRAQIDGLALGPEAQLAPSGHAALSAFLETAPCLASVTGIPSPRRGGMAAGPYGLDRITDAMGPRHYALVVVAEALAAEVVDDTMARCRRLMEEIYPRINATVSRSRASASTQSEQTTLPHDNHFAEKVMPQIAQIIAFTRVLGPIGAAAAAAAAIAGGSGRPQATRSVGHSQGETATAAETLTLLDADAQYCHDLLQRHHDRLAAARGTGWWRTAIYAAAEDEAALHTLTSVLRSTSAGDATALEPLRQQFPAEHRLREAMQYGRILCMRPAMGGPAHPLGSSCEALATCLSSVELAVIMQLPNRDIPGLSLRSRGDFALSVPGGGPRSVRLGRLRDAAGSDLGPVTLTARSLNEHVLVTGTPGSGKTNTCMRLLIEAHDRLGVPFLVIEPVKGEYRALAGEPSLQDRLRLYAPGGPDGLPLRLNPLHPIEGAPLLGHIDLLKAVFNASFAMYPGMPQVLEQAIVDTYEQRGWNLYTGRNDALGEAATADDKATLMPCLSDLYDQIETVLKRRGYGQDVHRNMGAALRSRLGSLMLGTKGLTLNSRRSTPVGELFEQPVVLDLQYLRDDEEKSFLMALVLAMLYQYCDIRQAHRPPREQEQLQHLTLIEEAHRLLAATPRASAESADARGKGVSMFTDMLAELRAKGEGFIVAEQIPTKLVSDVLKNTNLKIIHKLGAPTDRAAVGESINITEPQRRYLATLPKGFAVVHGLAAAGGDVISEAVLVEVELTKLRLEPAAAVPVRFVASHNALFRLGGCRFCSSPCTFYPDIERHLRDVRIPASFQRLIEAALGDRVAQADAAWHDWQTVVSRDGMADGHIYCAFLHVADTWLRSVMILRGDRDVDGGRAVRPRDVVLSGRLSAALGRFAATYLRRADDAARATAVAELGALLAGALTGPQAAPVSAGCDGCPVRCQMLPFVASVDLPKIAGRVAEALPRGGTDRFGNPGAIEGRWHHIDHILAAVGSPTPRAKHEPQLWQRGFRYCLIVQLELPDHLRSAQDEILAQFRIA